MHFSSEFYPLPLNGVHIEAEERLRHGWRYVQILAVNKDDGVDLVYAYMKDGVMENMVVSDVPREAHIPSISDLYLEAFVCENEIHDLFGVAFDDIAIDFLGNFYRLSTDKPMTIISPQQLAEREKLRKIAAAKEAKANAGAASPDDDMEAKLAGMDPEKAAKVRAAMEAKQRKAKDAEMEAKLAEMDPGKAAKVRAAMAAKAAKEGR